MTLDVEIMADQIRRAFRGESWHGPSVLEVLAGVSAEDAAAHPVAGAHSIWGIVLHMTAGYRLVLRRVRGENAQFSLEEGWPPVPALSAESWLECQRTLEELNQQLQSAVRAFPTERLSEALGSEYSAYTQFCGAPQHDLYHAGQITILKKALAASRGSA
ncbi:DinB family protein [Paludibaculum fermentans]|uniref:DinB family protein n=1 Tax=Paludibaculum fermentans TaxID=1473598 RepID=UPI003EB81235